MTDKIYEVAIEHRSIHGPSAVASATGISPVRFVWWTVPGVD